MTISIGCGSNTFDFLSKYPSLHIPAYPVADTSIFAPGAGQLLDGEWLVFDANRKLIRPTGTVAGLGGSAGAQANMNCYISTGNPGRSDLQVGGVVPYCMDDDFEFRTRLHTGNQEGSTGGGPQALALGHPCHLVITTLTIDGVDYAGKVALDSLTTAGATGHYVARCTGAPDANGWARFMAKKGFFA